MSKNQTTLIQIAIVLTAFLVGTALGYHLIPGGKSAVASSPAPAEPNTAAAAPRAPVTQVATLGKSADQHAEPSPGPKKLLADILKGRNSGDRTKELESFAQDIATTDIGAALIDLRRMPDGSARELAQRLLIARWIDADPEGAMQFAAKNHDFDYIASDVYQQYAAEGVDAALARAQAITDPNARYQALRGVLGYMADGDPLGALRLAGTLGPFPNNEGLDQMIYRQWSATDPQAAAAQAAQATDGGGWRSPVSQVLRNWASQDPLAALAWTSSVADPNTQNRDIAQIVRQWSRDDLNAAANWVNALTPGNTRDLAAASLAYSLGGSDPAAAIGWAQSISDTSQRDDAIQRLSREIMYRNPSNGAAILQAAGIPQNQIPAPPNPGQRGGGRRGR